MNWKCNYCTSLNEQVEKHCTQCNAPKQVEKQSFIKLKSPVTEVQFSEAVAKANWDRIIMLTEKEYQ